MWSYKCYEQSFYSLRISIYKGTFNKTQYLVTFSHRMSDVISELQLIVNPDSHRRTEANVDEGVTIDERMVIVSAYFLGNCCFYGDCSY